MDLTSRYVECYNRFCRYLIDNNIVDVDEDVLLLLLQNNLRESLGKCKMSSTNKNVCRALIKSGKRIGEECGKAIKNDSEYCKVHSKKEKTEEKAVVKLVLEEVVEIPIR
jgi:hypothetical protein